MYDTILIPTDGSSEAESAAEHGIELASDLGASVHVLYVIESGISGLPSKSIQQADRMGEMEAHGEELTARIESLAAESGVEATSAVRKGTVYKQIVDYTADNDIDAIVMGTRGRSGLEEFLIGSVTEKVVRTASVPVITVRQSKIGTS